MFCGRCGQENPDTFKFCNRCGSPLSLSEHSVITNNHYNTFEEKVRAVLQDSFRIIREIGRGGMAIVYLAHELALERDVALKVLPEQYSYNEDFITRFHREAKLQASLKHPNVINIFGIFNRQNIHFFSMEYINGITLKTYKQSRRLNIEKICYLVKQVCAALSYAHNIEKKLVHRDLKPSNVMIDIDSKAIVMDFGVARATEGTNLTLSGTMIGTPHYMSPEQIRGQSIDKRADIYSLGIILYEMVVGEVPFSGDTSTVYYKQVFENPTPPTNLRPDIPEWLEGIILKAMAKEPDKRFSDALEIADAINKSGISLSHVSEEIKEDVEELLKEKEISQTVAPKPPLLKKIEDAKTSAETPLSDEDLRREPTIKEDASPSKQVIIEEEPSKPDEETIKETSTSKDASVEEEVAERLSTRDSFPQEEEEDYFPQKKKRMVWLIPLLIIVVAIPVLMIIFSSGSNSGDIVQFNKPDRVFIVSLPRLDLAKQESVPEEVTSKDESTKKEATTKQETPAITKKQTPKQSETKRIAGEKKDQIEENQVSKEYKFCKKCGTRIPRAAKFCPKCGSPQ